MPSVFLPSGSFEASRNLILASATRPFQASGTLVASGFVDRKSWLRDVIWLWTWALLMFSFGLWWTTCTTVGMVMSLRATRSASPEATARAVNSSARR